MVRHITAADSTGRLILRAQMRGTCRLGHQTAPPGPENEKSNSDTLALTLGERPKNAAQQSVKSSCISACISQRLGQARCDQIRPLPRIACPDMWHALRLWLGVNAYSLRCTCHHHSTPPHFARLVVHEGDPREAPKSLHTCCGYSALATVTSKSNDD